MRSSVSSKEQLQQLLVFHADLSICLIKFPQIDDGLPNFDGKHGYWHLWLLNFSHFGMLVLEIYFFLFGVKAEVYSSWSMFQEVKVLRAKLQKYSTFRGSY